MVAPGRRLRLCLKDLYHQDVVEMIERETRAFELWEIVDPEDPSFSAAYDILWGAFGAHGEMEREDVIKRFIRDEEARLTEAFGPEFDLWAARTLRWLGRK